MAKPLISRTDFISTVAADRARVGALVARTPETISPTEGTGKTPPGIYINVAFATKFANLKTPVRELISFHLDNDKVWRVTGCTLH